MFAVAANLSGLQGNLGLFTDIENRHGIHGGASETSQMLHLQGHLVDMKNADDFAPATIKLDEEFRFLRAEGSAVGFGWQTQDLHPSGACGDATNADAVRGSQIVHAKAEGVAALLAEVRAFPLSRLQTR
jgi:creatinine amidohydrolase